MAIKAGTAYIAVELTNVQNLRNQLQREMQEAATRASTQLNRGLTQGASQAGEAAAAATSQTFIQRLRSSALGTRVSSLFSAIMASSAVTSARGYVSRFASSASSLWGRVTAPIGSVLSTFWNSTAMGHVRSFVTRAGTAIGGFARSVGTTIASIAGTVGSGAANAIGAIGSAVSTAASRISSLGTSIASLGRSLGLLAFQFTSVGFMASMAFTAPAVAVGTLATVVGVKLASQLENATVALRTRLGPAADAFIQQLRTMAIQSPVYDTTSIVSYAQKFIFAGLSVKQTTDFLKSFSNIALTSGMTSTDQMTLALEAFAQMLSKGKVSMEELRRQLGNSLPGALKIASDALGVTQAELNKMVTDGKLSATTLIEAITKFGKTPQFLKSAEAATTTLSAKWSLLKESLQTKLADIVLKNMDKIKSVLGSASGAADKFAKAFEKGFPIALEYVQKFVNVLKDLKDKFTELSPTQQKIVMILAAIAVAAGPVLIVMGMLGSAIAAITTFIGALMGPLGIIILVVAGVALLAYGISKLVEWIKNAYAAGGAFKEKIDGIWKSFKDNVLPTLQETWAMLKDKFVGIWNQLKESFSGVGDKAKPLLDVLKFLGIVLGVIIAAAIAVVLGALNGLIRALGDIVMAIVSFVGGIIKIFVGIFAFLNDLVHGRWGKLLGDLRLIWDGIWDAIVGTIVNVFKAIWNFVAGFVEGIVGFFKWLWEVLVGHSIIPDMVNAIKEWFDKLAGIASFIWNLIGSVINWFVENIIRPLVAKIAEVVQGIKQRWELLKAIFSVVIDAAKEKIGNLIQTVKEIPGKILDALKNAGSWLYETGKDIINGLVRGISDIKGKVVEKAKEIANSLPDWVKKVLGINSPSRVMMEIGKNVMQGYLIGLGDVDSVTAKADALASSISTPRFGGLTLEGFTDVSQRASLNIEHYHAVENTDPAKQAEAWSWLNRTRGY